MFSKLCYINGSLSWGESYQVLIPFLCNRNHSGLKRDWQIWDRASVTVDVKSLILVIQNVSGMFISIASVGQHKRNAQLTLFFLVFFSVLVISPFLNIRLKGNLTFQEHLIKVFHQMLNYFLKVHWWQLFLWMSNFNSLIFLSNTP
jgi:hypothetical protein